MGGFASWSLVGNFSYVFYSQGINLLINMFCGAAVNAARGIAVQVENAINQFTTNIQTAINPQIIKSYSQNNMHRMFTLIFASSKVCFYLMYILTLPVMLEATFILGIWLGKYRDHTINFLRLTLINTILNTLVNPMFTANLATGKVKIYHTVIGTLNVVCMPITYVVIRLTGIPETLFLLTVIMNMVGIFLRLFIMWKQIGMPITMWLHKVLLHIVLVVFSGAIIPFILYCMMDDTVSRFFAVCIACVICITLASYFLGLNVHERQMMTSKIVDIYHKKFRR
jgi:O-antigen/teichoic acid export membrane protein